MTMTPLRSLRLPLAALAAALLAVACGDSDPTAPVPVNIPVAAIDVASPAPVLVVGETMQLTATPKSAAGQPLQGRVVTWASATPDRATVTQAGVVTALLEGEARLTATSEGVTANLDLRVDPIPAAEIVLGRTHLELVEGDISTIAAVVRAADGRPLDGRTITWSSEAPSVATVDASGRVEALHEGATRIIARHGALEAVTTVTVLGTFVADLVFQAHDQALGGPRLYRTDLRSATPTSVGIFGTAGTWQAASSPAGSRLVFTCNDNGPAICTSFADGTGLRALTSSDAANEDEPAWSPDGTRIVYRRWPHGATAGPFNPPDLWIMDADGSNKVNLTADALTQQQPAWSPQPIDGAYRIVYTQESYVDGAVTSRLYTMRADGTDRRPLTAAGTHVDEDAAWSPDGRTVVFVRTGSTADGDLWVVDVVTGVEREFLGGAITDPLRHPSWSPDGRYLAFTSVHEPSPSGNYRRQIYTVRADGSDLRRRTTDELDKEQPTWLPRP